MSAQEHMNGALKERCHLALYFWMFKEHRVRLTAFWLNLTLSIELWHRGLIGGIVPRSFIVEFEAKRAPRRSAFSLAVWTKMSFPVRNGGSEGCIKHPSAAFERAQKSCDPDG